MCQVWNYTDKQQCSDVHRVAPLVKWLQLLQFWVALLPAARQKEVERMPDFYGMCRNSSTQHGSLSISPRTVSFLSSKVHPPRLPFEPPSAPASHFLSFSPPISSLFSLSSLHTTASSHSIYLLTPLNSVPVFPLLRLLSPKDIKVFLFSCLCLGLFLNYYTSG